MKIQRKSRLLVTVGLLLTALKAPPVSASLNNKDSHQTIISNPLVCLVGVSEYDTQKELPSVREEMRELYDLFYFDCGYEVNATFPYDKQYASSHKDLPKMRLSLNDLNQFLKQSYKELYQKDDFYDGLIFVFSGHGFINEYNCPLIATSDCKLQEHNNGGKDTLVGCTYFDDVKAQLTKLKKNDPKEKFVSKPKIFFNLSCQSNPAQNLPKEKKKKVTFPERALREEEKSGSISEEKRFERLKMKGAKNIIAISSALPSFTTGTQAGLKIVKCLRAQFKKSLNLRDTNSSLRGTWDYVRKDIKNASIPHPSGGLMTDEVFFSKKVKKREKFAYGYFLVPIVGSHATGKTAICNVIRSKKNPLFCCAQSIPEPFTYDYMYTSHTSITFRFYDTCGTEINAYWTRSVITSPDCIILCYSITRKDSLFDVTKRWKKEFENCLNRKCHLIVCGTGTDAERYRDVKKIDVTRAIEELRKSYLFKSINHIETSARDNTSIQKLTKLVFECLKRECN